MIVYPEDIRRWGGVDLNTLEWDPNLYTENLPFWLQWCYDGKHFALYSKNSELIKQSNLTKREAECIIIGVIEAFMHIEATLFNEWIID